MTNPISRDELTVFIEQILVEHKNAEGFSTLGDKELLAAISSTFGAEAMQGITGKISGIKFRARKRLGLPAKKRRSEQRQGFENAGQNAQEQKACSY